MTVTCVNHTELQLNYHSYTDAQPTAPTRTRLHTALNSETTSATRLARVVQ